MRHKVYTREHILKAAYEVIAKDGFTNFTARNVAKKMGVSTQPIYLEFENMQDLKNNLIEMVYKELEKKVFSVEHTGDKLVDMAINYIDFSQNNPRLFMALFVDEHGGGKLMYEFCFNYFRETIQQYPEYANFSDDYLKALHKGVWIAITGVAALMSSGIVEPTRQQIVGVINQTIESILRTETFENVKSQ
ncbi:TetR/AcrR family transcriptional regulator [Candidatus Enterococcus willemsii]|uniref:TetR family transcriptional regulator n=1 Tax=Candidatus Enterococcus willemsii TaxID=1857215 RepID=A0ABQ6YZR6_9ENTE|nr:TetR/AcrR family transcriptional regulator [Enterococcus sp. CU12B]KAF1303323.1 TetR family transcriptional regulator [Enterococcus sp. CU12B]